MNGIRYIRHVYFLLEYWRKNATNKRYLSIVCECTEEGDARMSPRGGRKEGQKLDLNCKAEIQVKTFWGFSVNEPDTTELKHIRSCSQRFCHEANGCLIGKKPRVSIRIGARFLVRFDSL